MSILEEISAGKILLSDGALGTILQSKGLQPGECPELWNITHRNIVREVAESYHLAGSDIVTTNSFGCNRIKLSQYGLSDRCTELNIAAAAIVKEAIGKDKHVAGSVGPTGKLTLTGDITEEELFDAFLEQVIALEKGGADIIIIETMTALDEAELAVKAAAQGTRCTIIATMTFSKDMHGKYHTIMGISPEEMTISLKEAGAHIIGSNCGNGISDMTGIVKAIRSADTMIPIIIQPNAGMPELIDGRTVFHESPQMMASFIPQLVGEGTAIIGGCCGTTPSHIRAFSKMLGR